MKFPEKGWNGGFALVATDAQLLPHGLPPHTTIIMMSLALTTDKQYKQAVETPSIPLNTVCNASDRSS
jgi:hypothetical protein